METDLGSLAEPEENVVRLLSIPFLWSRSNGDECSQHRSIYLEDIQCEYFIADFLTQLFEIGVHARDVRLAIFVDRFLCESEEGWWCEMGATADAYG